MVGEEDLAKELSPEESVEAFCSRVRGCLGDEQLQERLEAEGRPLVLLSGGGSRGEKSGWDYAIQLLPGQRVRVGAYHDVWGWLDRSDGTKNMSTYSLEPKLNTLVDESTHRALSADLLGNDNLTWLIGRSLQMEEDIDRRILAFKLGIDYIPSREITSRLSAIEEQLIGYLEDKSVEEALQRIAVRRQEFMEPEDNYDQFDVIIYRSVEPYYWADLTTHFRIALESDGGVAAGFYEPRKRHADGKSGWSEKKVYRIVEEGGRRLLVSDDGSRFEYLNGFKKRIYWEIMKLTQMDEGKPVEKYVTFDDIKTIMNKRVQEIKEKY